jgi:P-type E1-E2 ATPase
VPVAIIAGVSRATKHGILIKGGRALEMLSRVRALVIDKTGTLTHGRAHITATKTVSTLPPDEILRLAASLDQASQHTTAQTIVAEARQRGLALSVPGEVVETPGEGLEGTVGTQHVAVGGPRFVSRRVATADLGPLRANHSPGETAVALAVDGRLAGVVILADELRAGTEALLQEIKSLGIDRIVLATGDRRDVAETMVRGLSFDAVRSELTPDQKILVVLSERKNGPVMMIGDGINDAPALAAADVGMAMGANGAAAAAEAADVVLLVDQLDRVLPAMKIAKRSYRIALQSVYAGLGLSIAGMIAAAFGQITPVQGALLQEAIDVAVILNALRALYNHER